MFNEIASLSHWHPMVSGMIVMAILNSLVTTMPTPKLTSSEFYVWAFNFLHAVVGSLSRITRILFCSTSTSLTAVADRSV